MNRVILILTFFMIQTTFATEITVATYNVDTNVGRREEGFARETHKLWGANERAPLINYTIRNINARHHPDIWFFQETRNFTSKFNEHVDSVTPIYTYLNLAGYSTIEAPYNPVREKDFIYLTGYNSKRFEFIKSMQRYFSKTPDKIAAKPSEYLIKKNESKIKANNFGELYERSALMVLLKDKLTNDMIWAINVHLPFLEAPRLEVTRLLVDTIIPDLIKENPNVKIIVAGDFNSIPHMGGPAMEKIIDSSGLVVDTTKNLAIFNQANKYSSTFFGFPYDFGKKKDEELKKTGEFQKMEKMNPDDRREFIRNTYASSCDVCGENAGILDRVLTYGFSSSIATLNPIPIYQDDAPINYTDKEIQDYVLKHFDDGPAFASDHQPVVVKLTY